MFFKTAVCVETLKQALVGYSCIFPGSTSFLVNLLNHSTPFEGYDSPWQAQYGDGSGNEIYFASVNKTFIGLSFSLVSSYLFKHFQITLFAVKSYMADTSSYVSLCFSF